MPKGFEHILFEKTETFCLTFAVLQKLQWPICTFFLNKNMQNYAIVMDISNAFDTINHSLPLLELDGHISNK